MPVLLAALIAAAAPATAAARVPSGFVGMNVDNPIFDQPVNYPGQLNLMVGSGVESIRMVFAWSQAQPYRNYAALNKAGDNPHNFANVDGVPTRWFDILVYLAAQRGLRVLPDVQLTPRWDAGCKAPWRRGAASRR